jgi:hypothetical protein
MLVLEPESSLPYAQESCTGPCLRLSAPSNFLRAGLFCSAFINIPHLFPPDGREEK